MKTTYPLSIILAAIGAVIQYSCSPVLYSTNGQNVPLFHQKGEATLGIGRGSGSLGYDVPYFYDDETGHGLNLQTALAVDTSVAIIASLYSLKGSEDWDVNGHYLEIGGGLFKYNDKSKFVGELFAGIGFGNIVNAGEAGEYLKAKYIKYFLQPSGGFTTKSFDIAFTPRIGLVNYTTKPDSDYEELNDFLTEKKSTFVFEPGLTVRLGYKNVKFQYQVNYTTFKYEFRTNESEDVNPVIDTYQSIGVFFMISNFWKDR